MARTPDTRPAGGPGFPSTIWGDFLSTSGGSPASGRGPLEKLAENYWKPIFAYIRVYWKKSPEESLDLTQDFFLRIVEGGFLDRVEKGRGRFRAFLKASLENYLLDAEKRRRAAKRGGGRNILSIHAGDLPEIPDAAASESERVMDETWRTELLAHGAENLGKTLAAEGKTVHFAIFEEFFLHDVDNAGYRELGERYGLTHSDISNHLRYAKRKFREEVRELVAQTVETSDDLKAEMKWLFGESS